MRAAAEDGAAVVYRYTRAALEGAARLNLRLLAQAIATSHHSGAMVADEFLYIADVLAPLRRNEILFLGALHRCYTQVRGERPEAHLEGDRFTFGREATQLLKIALIPPVFPDWITLEAVGASLTRTGFVKEATVESAPVFLPTPLLSGLVSLINIEAACAAEGQKKP